MDVQKVAAQSATAQQSGQRKEDGAPKSLASFVDMIRNPVALAGPALDPFSVRKAAAEDNAQNIPETAREDQDVRRDDDRRPEQKTERNADDDATTRDVRSDKTDQPRDDAARDDSEPSRPNDETGQDKAADSDTGDGSADKAAKDFDDNDAEPVETGDNKPDVANENAEIHQPVSDNARSDLTLAPALDQLRQATQSGDGAVVKDAAKAVGSVAANTDANRQNAAANGDQGQNRSAADAAAQSRNQSASEALARTAAQTAGQNQANQQVNPGNQQNLADQQAQALTQQLKSDKPVRVQVRVADRGAATANPAQQTGAQTSTAQTDVQPIGASKPSSAVNTAAPRIDAAPAAEARADQAAAAAGQAQAQAQLAKGIANAVAETGRAHAAAQAGTNGTQAAGAAEASNATGQANAQAQQTGDAHRAAQAQAAKQPTPSRPIVQQISVNITKAIADGLDRINIQLRPEELGRVEVRLEVNKNGRVSAQVLVDRPETLELLRNDSRNLEKALQDAGFDTGAGDLSFDLRQQEQNGDGEKNGSATASSGDSDGDAGDTEAQLAQMILNGEPLSIISKDRVDIRA